MAMPISQELLISTLALLVALYLYLRNIRSKNPTMLLTPIYRFSSIMANLHNLHDHLTLVLTRAAGYSVRAHGPPGTGMRFFFTCDPANVRHLFTTNFSNFPKGEDFAAIFDILDGAILTVDGETWRRQRALLVDMLSSPRFVAGMGARVRNKVEKSLLPLCAGIARAGTPFDLQELTTRLMFDLTSAMVFGVDPGLLSSDRPPMTASGAMDAVMDVAFLRHTMPAFCWKTMRWLNIGPERRLQAAHIVLRGFVAEMIERRTITRGPVANDVEEKGTEDVISFFMNKPAYIGNDDLLRATLLGSMIAGRDTIGTTLPWIFYNLAQNPDTVSAIRNELSPIASRKTAGTMVIFEPHETKSLTYLKAALYETLRLYPPAPVARKTVILNDILPTGHEVYAGDTICVCLHSMGRMESIWGKDCLNYNPDRWLSEDGAKLRHVQSHKFLAFNSGPRICPGIEFAFMQMKTVVAAVIWNFDMEVVAGQTIEPKTSSLLQMKNGLILKLKEREI